MSCSTKAVTGCLDKEEAIMRELLNQASSGPGDERLILQQAMRKLRLRNGQFSEAEAILHMMDALIVESEERRGW